MEKFSQSIGKTPASKAMQIDSIDQDLRNRIWNELSLTIFDVLRKHGDHKYSPFYNFSVDLWHNLFKLPIDRIPQYNADIVSQIRDKYFHVEWFKTYDLIEFIATTNATSLPAHDLEEFKDVCNFIFEQEFSGYRFIGNRIAPITNKSEMEEIQHAISNTEQFTSFKGANVHLHSALEKISDKKSPDYRNSIKESISAIESIAKAISNNKKDSLGGALDKIKDKIELHPALEKGFKQLYGYTSDNNGIRHSLTEDDNCDFEDAKYMLVSCSAFVNYLIAKANKAGIQMD